MGKVLWLLVVGIAVAGVGYPLLHEGGHSLAALLMGGEVAEVRLLPSASVLCQTSDDPITVTTVGLGGILLPALVAALLPHRRFGCWYLRFILLSVCWLTLAFSLAAVGCYGAGHPLPQEDVSLILRHAPQALPFLTAVLAGGLTAVTSLWVTSHPLRRWTAFLGSVYK